MNQHPDPKSAIIEVLAADKVREQSETLAVLDTLRRTRKARGGSGAPLQVPAHLLSAANGQGIVITDEDLKDGTPLPASFHNQNVGVKVEQ